MPLCTKIPKMVIKDFIEDIQERILFLLTGYLRLLVDIEQY